ncbi:hypothetical protein DOM22_07180 [Bdellovibrio sp. ZAP7]|uniref:PQQ-like beta-propeller repeat protein n=1 Tax=Bdellovibrio sp. ZAP7 TaxID=2231053 RepID=UPI0011582551|nr:PQQ-like beta-propeller repeat protein [Bdellovibrio sp. ZAP7]QDK44960.1 hypothetical protein DOM22_07180 [Bdellovibrio sp. ZAP7]
MFGLMEITAQLDEPTKLAIIPTVVLPFTILGMILTSLATWVAAFFGVELKAEGPKRLFEVLMKPKVIVLALLSNLVVYAGIKTFNYISNGPYPLWWVDIQNSSAPASEKNYSDLPPVITPSEMADSPRTLEVAWEIPLHSAVFGTPVIRGGSLFAGLDRGKVMEVDLEQRKVIRHFEIGKPVMAAPLILNNRLFVGEGIHLTHGARLYSFDLKTGKFAGAFSTTGHVERSAVSASVDGQDILLFPAGKDGLYAITSSGLKKIWQASIGHVDSYPAIDKNKVFIGTGLEEGYEETPTKAYALDLRTGKPLWEKNLPTSVWGIPVFWENVVCFSVGDIYKTPQYGQLSCYDKETGKEYFSYNTSGALISAPVILDNHLIVSDLYGKIYQFDLKNRTLDWILPVPTRGETYASVVINDQDQIIFPGAEGLYIYSRANQKLITVWKPEKTWAGTYTNVVSYKDQYIFTDQSGILRGLRFKKVAP